MQIMFYTYILYSKSLETFYKGSTSDIVDRVNRHNSGYERYTRKGAPWILLWVAEKSDRSEAYRLEMKLKNLSRVRTIKFILKYIDGVAGPDELLLVKQLSEC